VTLLAWCLSLPLLLAAATWSPGDFADDGTVEFLTVVPDEGEHWSTVWFVVLDGTVYLRLGPRAAKRLEGSSTAPRLQLRVAGEQSHAMRWEKAPDMAVPVAAAMRGKYWSDVLGEPFRKLGLSSPSVIVRLVPDV
jgi:hypothetical protein